MGGGAGGSRSGRDWGVGACLPLGAAGEAEGEGQAEEAHLARHRHRHEHPRAALVGGPASAVATIGTNGWQSKQDKSTVDENVRAEAPLKQAIAVDWARYKVAACDGYCKICATGRGRTGRGGLRPSLGGNRPDGAGHPSGYSGAG